MAAHSNAAKKKKKTTKKNKTKQKETKNLWIGKGQALGVFVA